MGNNEILMILQEVLDNLQKKQQLFKEIYSIAIHQSVLLQEDDIEKNEEDNEKLEEAQQDYEKLLDLRKIKMEEIDELNQNLKGLKEYIQKQKYSNVTQEYEKDVEIFIYEIREIIISIQEIDNQNKQTVEKQLMQTKNKLQKMRKGQNTIANYYQNTDVEYMDQSFFIDKKK